MTDPLAAFFTWTTYGTWLPGDPRGFVSNILKPGGGFERRHNVPGTPFTADDRYTFDRAQKLLKYPPVKLSLTTAAWAADGLVVAAKDNKLCIVRGAVMATHVHLLVPLLDDKPKQVRKMLKGRASRHMSDQQGKTFQWWAAGGSDELVFTDDSMMNVIRYIEGQERILALIVNNEIVLPEH